MKPISVRKVSSVEDLFCFSSVEKKLQHICNLAATESLTAIKARGGVKEGTIRGQQGHSTGDYREHPPSREVCVKDLV